MVNKSIPLFVIFGLEMLNLRSKFQNFLTRGSCRWGQMVVRFSILSLVSVSFLLTSLVLAEELTLSCPGKEISFKVELAQTPEEMTKGLMFRETLEDDAGMLFFTKRLSQLLCG